MTTTAEDVWKLLAELVAAQKATDLQLQETDRQLKETDRQLKETDRQLKETDHNLNTLGQTVRQEIIANNQQIEALRQEVKSTNQAVKMMSKELGNLGGKWGRFVENIVAPACETIFLKREIPVHQVSQRVKKRREGQLLEIDILVTNENHVLVVEVKSSLSVDDVKDLVDDLQQFRYFFPEYAQKQLYGAVAGIEIEEGADKYAYRQGFFVLAQAGETVAILNNDTFQPKNW